MKSQLSADIVIINYNDKVRIKRAIDSAINQTYDNVNVIVVDDGSDEATREIYKKYEGSIKLIQLERTDMTKRTPSRARNAGIKAATGDYICFLDSDNYYDKDFVKELISKQPDVGFCNWQIVGLETYAIDLLKVWKYNDLLKNYLAFQHLDHQCLLIKRSYLDKAGYYDERLPRSQDCDLIVRLINLKGNWEFNPNQLFTFEKHEVDQNKQAASIHGKCLWSLKNDLNPSWLLGLIKSNMHLLSYVKGINDFCNDAIWKDDYDKSEFKKLKEQHLVILGEERSEKIN